MPQSHLLIVITKNQSLLSFVRNEATNQLIEIPHCVRNDTSCQIASQSYTERSECARNDNFKTD